MAQPVLDEIGLFDDAVIGGLRTVAPGEVAVLRQQHAGRFRRLGLNAGGEFGKLETRHDIGDEHHAVAEQFGHHLARMRQVGKGQERGGVWIDEFMRQERMKKRFHRRVGRRRIHKIGALDVDHFLVRKRIERPQFQKRRKLYCRKTGRLDGAEVPSRSLDAKNIDGLTEIFVVTDLQDVLPPPCMTRSGTCPMSWDV